MRSSSAGAPGGDGEDHPLLPLEDVRQVQNAPLRHLKQLSRQVLIFTAIGIVGIFLLSATKSKSNENEMSSPATVLEAESGSSQSASQWSLYRQGYETLPILTSTFLKYNFLGSFDGIVEPHVIMRLNTSDLTRYKSFSHLKFEVCPADSRDVKECVTGVYNIDNRESSDFEVSCSPSEKYNIEITPVKLDGADGETSDTLSVLCLYVRRDIRTLTAFDLNATMDAMAVLWNTDEEAGQAIYGENFHNISYFTRAHFYGASHRDADHIHEGLGFLPQHLKLSTRFEAAMQAVDMSVSLPYWDFTKDVIKSKFDSIMFSPDTFGSLVAPDDDLWNYGSNSILDARIPDGRWANLRVEAGVDFSGGEVSRNAYGYMRAPWNLNPSPYLTRFPTSTDISQALPSCKSYHKWLKISDLEDFLYAADTYPHTTAHDSVGGYFGCDVFDFMVDKGWVDSNSMICFKWGTFLKDLWREGFLVADETCAAGSDVDAPTCGFTCDGTRGEEMITELASITSSFLNSEEMSHSDWSCFKKFICEADGYKSFFGDQRESASCFDPSFWPIHPTLERAYQAKLLAGGFETTEWPDNVCYRQKCYNDSGVEGYFDDCCWGHNSNDRFPNFISGNRYDEGLWWTNIGYLDAIDPTGDNYEMTYVYDSFSWSHCGDDDIDGLLQSLYDGTYVVEDDTDDKTLSPTPSVHHTAMPTFSVEHTHHPTPTDLNPSAPQSTVTRHPTTFNVKTFNPTHEDVPTHKPTISHAASTPRPSAVTRTRAPTNDVTVDPTCDPSQEPSRETKSRSPSSTPSTAVRTQKPSTGSPSTAVRTQKPSTGSPTAAPVITRRPTSSVEKTRNPTTSQKTAKPSFSEVHEDVCEV